MNRIKTKLKFKKSDQTGNWVGFVSINKVNGMIMLKIAEEGYRLTVTAKGVVVKAKTSFPTRRSSDLCSWDQWQ